MLTTMVSVWTVGVLCLCLLSINVCAQNWPATSSIFSSNYQTASAPVLTVSEDGNMLYVAFSNSNGIFFANTTNAGSWPQTPAQIPGQATNSGSSPAFIVYRGKLVVAFHSSGTSNILAGTSSDGGATWSISMLPNSFQTARGPRFTIFRGILYLYYQGTDNNVYFATSSDGSFTTNPIQIPNVGTSQAPALIEFNRKLVLALRSTGTTQIFTAVSSDGQTFPSVPVLPSFYQSQNGVVLATYGCSLYMIYEDPSQGMYISISKDGVNWPNVLTKVLPSDATSFVPALQEFKGQLVLMFRSSGSNGLLFASTSP